MTILNIHAPDRTHRPAVQSVKNATASLAWTSGIPYIDTAEGMHDEVDGANSPQVFGLWGEDVYRFLIQIYGVNPDILPPDLLASTDDSKTLSDIQRLAKIDMGMCAFYDDILAYTNANSAGGGLGAIKDKIFAYCLGRQQEALSQGRPSPVIDISV